MQLYFFTVAKFYSNYKLSSKYDPRFVRLEEKQERALEEYRVRGESENDILGRRKSLLRHTDGWLILTAG